MEKSFQDSDKAVRAILRRHSLTFSERGINSILKFVRNYQSSLKKPNQPTKSQMRNNIKSLQDAARKLSDQLQGLSWHIALEDPPDSLQLRLNHLVLCCEHWLIARNSEKSKSEKFQNEGRPPKTLPLKFLVQMLILIFEEETGKSYVIQKPTVDRDRTVYCPLAQAYVKSILEFVAPDEDPHEALKTARRFPIPLDWARKMKKIVDEDLKKST